VAEVNTPDDETLAHVSSDELTLYLNRGNFVAVYTRDKKSDTWKGGAGLDVNGGNSSNVRVTDDTLRAYFDAYLGGGVGATRLITKSRPTTTSPFEAALNRTIELGAEPGVIEADPFPSPNEQLLYFASNRSGAFALYVASKANDKWATFLPLKNANSAEGDRKPVIAADGSYVYFQSARPPGKVGEGTIWIAHRTLGSADLSAFETPKLVDEVLPAGASGSSSWPTWASPDHCRLYFMSNRPGGKGNGDLWLASRSP